MIVNCSLMSTTGYCCYRTTGTLHFLLATFDTMPASLHDALASIQQQLGVRVDNSLLEAEILVEHITGVNRTQQRLRDQILLSDQQLEDLEQLTKRRAGGEPLAYVLGNQPFWTLELQVTPDVLIPRPETELLVERALHHLPADMSAQVVDLGTGSGAIALSIAHERPQWRVWATDASARALAVARRNARRLQLCNVQFTQGKWCEPLGNERFHLIISNPPYIGEGDPHLEPAVLAHEPRMALLSGHDGLDAIRNITRQAPTHLHSGGWILLEHGWQQAAAVQALLESAGFVGVASHADLAGHLRVTEGRIA